MKKLIVFGGLLLLVVSSMYLFLSTSKNKKVVAAVFPVTVDAFTQFQNKARTVFEKEGVIFYIYSAEGDASRFHTIIDAALLRNPDVLILVGTQLTNVGLGSRYENRKQKIIASCISDIGKVETLQSIGISPPRKKEVAILSDMPKQDAYKLSAEAISTILPTIKNIAILYNKSEINSENTATSLANAFRAKGKLIIDAVVSGEDDVPRIAANAMRKGAQLLVIPHDKYVIKNAVTLSKMGMESNPKVPVFALDDGTVKKDGAALGVSVNYGFIGELTAKTALSIINGQKPELMDVIQQDNANLLINRTTWEQLGLPDLKDADIQAFKPILVD